MPTKPPELTYGVDDRPPLARLVALGLQYAILVSVYLIFVVLIARAAGASSTTAADLVALGLLALAIGMVAQCWPGRFFGSGYLAPPSYSAIYFAPALVAAKLGGLPAVAGMTIFAGLCEIGLSFLFTRLKVIFQPTIAGFTVFVVGVQLGLVGIINTLDVPGENSPDFHWHVGVAVFTLAACIGFSIWGRGIFRLISTLIGLAAGVVVALFAGMIGPAPLASVAAAPWFAVPDPSILSYSFDFALVPAFIAAGLAATIRTIGTVASAQRINDADWKRPDTDNLRRGVFGDGLSCIAAGLLGGPGISIAPSIVGISGATGATSRAIAWAATVLLVAFAFLPKIGAAIVVLPLEVAGAILVFASSFMIVSGVQIMASRGLDLRAGFAISISLFLGLLTATNPAYFSELPDWVQTITSDMLTVSLTSAIAITLLFRIGIRSRDVVAWRQSDAARDDLAILLDRHAREWKLDSELVERARDTVTSLVEHLKSGQFLTEPVTFKVSFDTLELEVDLVYRGRPLSLTAHTHHDLIHEESAATAGFASYALGLHADGSSVAAHGDAVTIRLWFTA